MSRQRLRRDERRQLVDLRVGERHFSRPMHVKIWGGSSVGAETVRRLRRRGMLRAVDAVWEDTPGGGRVQAERFSLTDRGRVVADQLILQHYARHVRYGADFGTHGEALAWRENRDLAPYVARVRHLKGWARDGREWELRFRGRAGLRAWPAPEDPSVGPSPAELGMAPPRPGWDPATMDAYQAIRRRALETRQYGKSLSFAERHGFTGRMGQAVILSKARPDLVRRAEASLRERGYEVISGELEKVWRATFPEVTRYQQFIGRMLRMSEPLDRAINALDGISFVEDAHRRLRALTEARREHDGGDEDDGAIERGIAECERLLRKDILGHCVSARYGHLMPYTVSRHAIEAAKADPPRLWEALAKMHDEAEKSLDGAGDRREDEQT